MLSWLEFILEVVESKTIKLNTAKNDIVHAYVLYVLLYMGYICTQV